MRGNPDNLRRAAAAKSAAATARAEQGIRDMVRRGEPITFRGLAQTAAVSLDFLYRNTEIRQRVEHLRTQQRPSARPPAPAAQIDPSQPSSVVRTLTAQLTELKRRHREEVNTLKQALEAAHGENLELRRRVGHHPAVPQRATADGPCPRSAGTLASTATAPGTGRTCQHRGSPAPAAVPPDRQDHRDEREQVNGSRSGVGASHAMPGENGGGTRHGQKQKPHEGEDDGRRRTGAQGGDNVPDGGEGARVDH